MNCAGILPEPGLERSRWTNTNEFTRLWAAREFGPGRRGHRGDCGKYTKYNGRRKPELLEAGTYSLEHYQEAERVVADFQAIRARAEEISRNCRRKSRTPSTNWCCSRSKPARS